MMAMLNLAKMDLFMQVKSYSSLKLFDLRSKNGHLLYQNLCNCDLPGEGIPDKDYSCR